MIGGEGEICPGVGEESERLGASVEVDGARDWIRRSDRGEGEGFGGEGSDFRGGS